MALPPREHDRLPSKAVISSVTKKSLTFFSPPYSNTTPLPLGGPLDEYLDGHPPCSPVSCLVDSCPILQTWEKLSRRTLTSKTKSLRDATAASAVSEIEL